MSAQQMVHNESFIGGAWRPGGGETFEVRSPYSGEVVTHIASCDGDDVDRAVDAARRAQPGWARLPAADRARVVRRALMQLRSYADDVARMVATETGRTMAQARAELLASAEVGLCRARAGSSRGAQEPLGVVGIISSCGAPADWSVSTLAEVLAGGGGVVWRTSAHAPMSCAVVGGLLVEAGIPPGVINIVHGSDAVGSAIAAHRGVDQIRGADVAPDHPGTVVQSRPGPAPGRVEQRLAAQLAAIHDEVAWIDDLAPVWRIVLNEGDLDAAAEHAVQGCFHFAARWSKATERILVHADVHDAFVAKLSERMAQLRIGDPTDEQTELGPLHDRETHERLVDLVDDAWTRGATIAQFGPSTGLFFPATILTGVTPEMRVASATTYGPVAPIIEIASADEAVEVARQCAYARNEQGG